MIHLWRLDGAAPARLQLGLLGIKRSWQHNPVRPRSRNTGKPRWWAGSWIWHTVARWAWRGCGSNTALPTRRWSLSGMTLDNCMAKARPDGTDIVTAVLPWCSIWIFLFTRCLPFPASKCCSLGNEWCLKRKGTQWSLQALMRLTFDTFGTRGCSRSLHHHHSLGRKKWGA